MRIIRGKFKTRKYSMPKGFPSRPTTNFAKEGLFNIIEHQYNIDDLNILDLCAGTGNLSFEFLSREYGNVTAVDKNFVSIRHMRKMAQLFDCEADIQIIKSDIIKFLKQTSEKYDLIIADPPYDVNFHKEIEELVFERELLSENGVLIIEHGRETDLSDLKHFVKTKKYSNVYFSFFENTEL